RATRITRTLSSLTSGDSQTSIPARASSPIAGSMRPILIGLRAAHIGAHVAERGVCDAAQRLDRDEAGQDDQGQPDRVFHRRRALFGHQKTLDAGRRAEHDGTSTEKAWPAFGSTVWESLPPAKVPSRICPADLRGFC